MCEQMVKSDRGEGLTRGLIGSSSSGFGQLPSQTVMAGSSPSKGVTHLVLGAVAVNLLAHGGPLLESLLDGSDKVGLPAAGEVGDIGQQVVQGRQHGLL